MQSDLVEEFFPSIEASMPSDAPSFLLAGLLLSVYFLWRSRRRSSDDARFESLLAQLGDTREVQLKQLILLVDLFRAVQPDAEGKLLRLIHRARNPSPFDNQP